MKIRWTCTALLAAVPLSLLGCAGFAPPPPPPVIAIDERFEDWARVEPAAIDAWGDASAPDEDFGRVWVASDRERLLIRFEIGAERNLQNDNAFTLFIDADDSPQTGLPVDGLGADVEWLFGARLGVLHAQSGERRFGPATIASREVEFRQGAIGMRQAPTLTSTQFEISFDRASTVEGASLFPAPRIALRLAGPTDSVPDRGEVIRHTFDNTPTPPPPLIPLSRERPGDIRLLCHNVLYDGLTARPEDFAPLLRAIAPDIICFQELFRSSPERCAQVMDALLPAVDWQLSALVEGTLIVSRFPILASEAIGTNVCALIDLPDTLGASDLLVINMHPPCCGNNAGRQEEFDTVAAWIRDRQGSGGAGILPPGTPIIIAGDMNLVGLSEQRRTLLGGDIGDEATHGPDHAPDWDGTALRDVHPRHVATRDIYTWRSDWGGFAPGRLDHIVFSDSVLALGNAFTLWTPEMPEAQLTRWGLAAEATPEASDHLPLVADFRLRGE